MAQPQAKQQRNSLKGIAIFAGLSPETVERIERRCAWKESRSSTIWISPTTCFS